MQGAMSDCCLPMICYWSAADWEESRTGSTPHLIVSLRFCACCRWLRMQCGLWGICAAWDAKTLSSAPRTRGARIQSFSTECWQPSSRPGPPQSTSLTQQVCRLSLRCKHGRRDKLFSCCSQGLCHQRGLMPCRLEPAARVWRPHRRLASQYPRRRECCLLHSLPGASELSAGPVKAEVPPLAATHELQSCLPCG